MSRFASSFDHLQPDFLYLVRHALPVFVDMVFPFLIPYFLLEYRVSRFASSFENLQPDLLYLVRHALPVLLTHWCALFPQTSKPENWMI